jgi:hypothetical protein
VSILRLRIECFLTAGLCWIAAAEVKAAHPVGPAGAPSAPELMLYFSQSIGAGGTSAKPKFGLSFSQARQLPNTGDPRSGDAFQHRELIKWQMQAHSDISVELGRRVTYDLTRGAFAAQVSGSTIAIERPTLRNGPAPKPLGARVLEPSRGASDTFQDSARNPWSPQQLAATPLPRAAAIADKTGQPEPARHREPFSSGRAQAKDAGSTPPQRIAKRMN